MILHQAPAYARLESDYSLADPSPFSANRRSAPTPRRLRRSGQGTGDDQRYDDQQARSRWIALRNAVSVRQRETRSPIGMSVLCIGPPSGWGLRPSRRAPMYSASRAGTSCKSVSPRFGCRARSSSGSWVASTPPCHAFCRLRIDGDAVHCETRERAQLGVTLDVYRQNAVRRTPERADGPARRTDRSSLRRGRSSSSPSRDKLTTTSVSTRRLTRVLGRPQGPTLDPQRVAWRPRRGSSDRILRFRSRIPDVSTVPLTPIVWDWSLDVGSSTPEHLRARRVSSVRLDGQAARRVRPLRRRGRGPKGTGPDPSSRPRAVQG